MEETAGADAVVPPRPTWRGSVRARAAARHPRIELGEGLQMGRGVVLRAAPGARLVVEPGVAIGDGARLEARDGVLRVGAGAALGAHASLAGAVTIGRECVIGDWARAEGDAVLDDRARLAAHAVALAGARVGRGAVVASYVVVDGAVAAGTVGRAPAPSVPPRDPG
jgi:UDP-3-O-[3-hydroxymyristoyl] glucosamine N-acyltransferase